MHAVLCSALLGLVVTGLCAQEPERFRLEQEGVPIAEIALEVRPDGLVSRSERDGEIVTASVEWDARRMIQRYELLVVEAETKARRGRIVVVRSSDEDAYLLREEGALGAVRRTLLGPPASVILDPEAPALLVPMLTQRAGFVHVLDLGQRRVRGPLGLNEKGPRELELELEGPVIRLFKDDQGRFDALQLTAQPLRRLVPAARPLATSAVPEGVTERTIDIVFEGETEPRQAILCRPSADGPAPGILLLPSAGPRDVDGVGPSVGSGITRDLARDLARAGFSSLRFPKRGLEARWNDLVQDARRAATVFLGETAVHGGVVHVLGHGEGALIAAELLADASLSFRGGALLALPGRPIAEAMEAQLRADLAAKGQTEAGIEREVAELRETFATLAATEDLNEVPPESRLLKDLMEVRPVERVLALKKPFFLGYGQRDQRVPPAHQSVIRTALALQSGVQYRFHLVMGADHAFRDEAGSASGGRSPALISELAIFLKELGPLPREGS